MWSRILGPWTTAAVLTVAVLNGLWEHRPGSVLFALYLVAAVLLPLAAYPRRSRGARRRLAAGLVLVAVAVVGVTAFLEWREGVAAPRLLLLFALAATWGASHATDRFIVRFRTRPADDGIPRLGGPEGATAGVPLLWSTAALLWTVYADAGNELGDAPAWVTLPLVVAVGLTGLMWLSVALITWFSVPGFLMWLSPPARRAALRRGRRRRGAKRRLARAEEVLDALRQDIRAANQKLTEVDGKADTSGPP